ncbi:MAG: excinuclease ABC subunit UvrA, partial [Bacteroidales bacterium]|nr:excinuclease ABC subunit UvrA [Bacteroidales bacterium]
MKTQWIKIYEARENNLKIDYLEIPTNKLICITGLSGSGKSSLAMDTIYAEGQRRYIESLSAYTRQFLGKIKKPNVKSIEGLSPAIAIERKHSIRTPRSTVGTITEIYDYLKLLFAKIGKIVSPVSGKIIKKHTIEDIQQFLFSVPIGEKIFILSKIPLHHSLSSLKEDGFSRIFVDGKLYFLDEISPDFSLHSENVYLFIDRFIIREDKNESIKRIIPSVELSFQKFNECILFSVNSGKYEVFTTSLFQEGIQYLEPSVELFSFNHTYGACPTCNGYGNILGIDPNLVIPDPNLSVFDGAIAPWRGEKSRQLLHEFLAVASKYKFPVHTPYKNLTEEQKNLLWNGSSDFWGINDFFNYLEKHPHKIQNRIMLAKYRGKTTCPSCKGSRLRQEALWIKINGKNIAELSQMQISLLANFIENLQLSEYEEKISYNILREIRNRLNFMLNTGLDYLTLDRPASTLSGGEMQRILLTRALGSNLAGSIYILDEPTIGIHPHDTHKMIRILKNLVNYGNTVIVVEHDEDIIRHADFIIELGPKAGNSGGKVVFSGHFNELIQNTKTHTSRFFRKEEFLPLPSSRRKSSLFIHLYGAKRHNLKNIHVSFPLHAITAITGVSGSGKSTLVHYELYPALLRLLGLPVEMQPTCKIEGDIEWVKNVTAFDQKNISTSSRSNPATFIKAFDDIRQIYALHPISKQRGYTAGNFSFNSPGGRCETCQGTGEIEIEMQFLANVKLICESCQGKRYKEDVLDIEIQGKNLYDLLNLTIDEAINFLEQLRSPYEKWAKNAIQKLSILRQIGMGYVLLGQNLSTLSTGELQRLKLASYMQKSSTEHTIFIFDEPTTGLHYHDIIKLFEAMETLIQHNNTVIFIEHNMELVKCADYVIELGPEGGE